MNLLYPGPHAPQPAAPRRMKGRFATMLKRLERRLALARRILESHWAQPATALFRTFETEVVRRHLRAAGEALDLGCGDGTLAPVLLECAGAADWCGADLDAREVRLAAHNGPYRRVYAASAAALPERRASRDLVFANSALEHMGSLGAVISEVSRVVKPGGRFVFTVPSAELHRCLFWPRVVERIGGTARRERYLAALDRRLAHVNYLSPEGWREILACHGFDVLREEAYLSPRLCGWWETLANLSGGLVHLLQRNRRSPREVQLRLGIGGRSSRTLGLVSFLLLLPVLLWTGIEGDGGALRGALYVECAKRPIPSDPSPAEPLWELPDS